QAQKRVRDLPRLVDELERRSVPFELLIAGAGPEQEWLRRNLDGAAPGRVRFLGNVPRAELNERFYGRIDAVLITSSWETGPIVAWEAMAAGVPILASRYVGSGLEGGLQDGVNSLMFPVGDMAAAADCVERALDRRVRETIARGGFDLVRRRYS